MWSPALRNSAKTRLYWKLRLREVTQGADYSATFSRWQTQIQVHDPSFAFPYLAITLPEESIRTEFYKATDAFRKCQKNSRPLRMRTYEELLEKYEKDMNSTTMSESRRKAKIVRDTIDGEVLRTKFRDIRCIMRPSTSASLSKLLIPRRANAQQPDSTEIYNLLQNTAEEDCLVWETVVERDQLERHLLDYNRVSFRAAAESPCGHGVIHDAITFSSISPASVQQLAGQVPADWHQDDGDLKISRLFCSPRQRSSDWRNSI